MSESSADEPLRRGSHFDPAGHGVPADDLPVPAGPATLPPGRVRPEQGPECLVLRAAPYAGIATRGALAAGLPIVVIYAAAQLLAGADPMVLAFILVPATLLWMLLWGWVWYRQTILPRVTFDRNAGLLMLGWKGRRGRRPLSTVIGVQVMQTRKQFGGPEHNIPAVTMYQMNLILDDPAERRLNVMTSDPSTARSTARQVADFLGVQVLDSADAPLGAPEADAAEPMSAEFMTVQSPVVTEPRPDVLLIRPRRLALLGGFRAMLSVSVCLLLLASQCPTVEWSIAIVGVAGALPCLPLLSLGRQARFDRARGVLTLGRLGRRATRSLASVKAVEVVGCPPGYQMLNLLLDDSRQQRLNLIFEVDANAALVRRAGDRVASFLGVPLLAAGRQPPSTARTGAGGTGNPLEELNRSPLPPGSASVRGPACLVPQGDDALLLRPRSRLTWVRLVPALLSTGLGVYLVWHAWLGPAAGQAGLGQWAFWLTVLLLGQLAQLAALRPLLLYRDHFDRQAGLLTLGWFGLKGTYPLANVLAVQLIPGGLVEKTPGPFGRGGERVSYQLNLVIADAYEDRLNLTDDSDLEWARQAAHQVAEFLGVPAIDQVADGD